VIGGTNDHADCTDVLAVLDAVLRRHCSHTTTDAQLLAGVAVSGVATPGPGRSYALPPKT